MWYETLSSDAVALQVFTPQYAAQPGLSVHHPFDVSLAVPVHHTRSNCPIATGVSKHKETLSNPAAALPQIPACAFHMVMKVIPTLKKQWYGQHWRQRFAKWCYNALDRPICTIDAALCHSPPPSCDCRWCLMSTKERETQLREIRLVKCQQRGSVCGTALLWTKTRQHEGNECCKVIVTKQRQRSIITDFAKLGLSVLFYKIQVRHVPLNSWEITPSVVTSGGHSNINHREHRILVKF